jgi:radical SAM protein with 4Fe4S-binding SPASM domain
MVSNFSKRHMIQEIEYSEFSLKLHDTAVRNDIPLDGTIALTSHCNLNCRHCYIRDNSAKNELTTQELFRLIDEITDAGCVYLLLTGGEPLLRPDFKEIYAYARKKGLIVSLFTNGTLIDADTAMLLKKFMPFSVEITLYGASPETYESFTGTRGTYDSCMNGIKLLVEHEIPLTLKTMITNINKHEVPEMKEFAESLGLDFRYGLAILPHVNGSRSPYDIRISPSETIELEFNDTVRSREWSALYDKFNAPASKELLFNCGAGKNCFSITAQGRLRICDIVPEPDYCLRENRFIDGYRMFGPIMARKLKGATNCAGCEHITFCDSCPGISLLEGNKDGETPVSYHCEIAHKRVKHLTEEDTYAKEKTLQKA